MISLGGGEMMKINIKVLLLLFVLITLVPLPLCADGNVKVVRGKLVKPPPTNSKVLDEVEVAVPVLKGRLVSTPYQYGQYYYDNDDSSAIAWTLGLTALFLGLHSHHGHYSAHYRHGYRGHRRHYPYSRGRHYPRRRRY